MPPKLTVQQKNRLSTLEPALHQAVYCGNYTEAKLLAVEIQRLLRATGHETRLMQSKNWLYEAALNAGEILTAEIGFRGVLSKTKSTTKVHLEAMALLVVCLLKQNKLSEAEVLIPKVLNSKNIKTSEKRKVFISSVAKRFEMEGFISAVRNLESENWDVNEIDLLAGKAVMENKSEHQLFIEIGAALPATVLDYVNRIDKASRKQLTQIELKYLSSPDSLRKQSEQGKNFFDSLKLVIWKSMCDPQSEIYKAWFTNGISHFLSKKYYTFAVTSALLELGFAVKAVAVPVIALLIKLGVEVYCERYKPAEILDGRSQ
ncbi:MAG TPA: hypothetical protein VGJ90_06145 [Methylophilaceae bacterium]|jgi:hypothetical protein